MRTKLPTPMCIRVPESMVSKVHLKNGSLYLGEIKIKVENTVMFLDIRTWRGIELAVNMNINLFDKVKYLSEIATEAQHKDVVFFIKLKGGK